MESLRFTFEQNPLQIVGIILPWNSHSVVLIIDSSSYLVLFASSIFSINKFKFYWKFSIWNSSEPYTSEVSIMNFFIRWKLYPCLSSESYNDDFFFLNKLWNLQLLNTQKCRNCFEIAISNQNRCGHDTKGDTVELTIKQRNCFNILWTKTHRWRTCNRQSEWRPKPKILTWRIRKFMLFLV